MADIIADRFYLQIEGYFYEYNGFAKDYEKDRSYLRYFQMFSARMVLEVWGAAGAIWGCSEAVLLRRPDTQEIYRLCALLVGAIFLFRWIQQSSIFLFSTKPAALENPKPSICVRVFQIFSPKIVLEVFGGAGAIWGFSEICTLRRPETYHIWRVITLTIGGAFFVRFLLEIKDYVSGNSSEGIIERSKWRRLLGRFGPKIVLEVFGGAGAIWGFSEVCTFRTQDTQEFWRFNALFIGAIFFLRFLCQINDFLNEHCSISKLGNVSETTPLIKSTDERCRREKGDDTDVEEIIIMSTDECCRREKGDDTDVEEIKDFLNEHCSISKLSNVSENTPLIMSTDERRRREKANDTDVEDEFDKSGDRKISISIPMGDCHPGAISPTCVIDL